LNWLDFFGTFCIKAKSTANIFGETEEERNYNDVEKNFTSRRQFIFIVERLLWSSLVEELQGTEATNKGIKQMYLQL